MNLGLRGDVSVGRVGVAAVLGDVHARALDIGRGAEDARELEGHEARPGAGERVRGTVPG